MDNPLKHHAIAAGVAAAISAGGVGYVTTRPEPAAIVKAVKHAKADWPELDSVQSDLLAKLLKDKTTPGTVSVMCASDHCRELAGDFVDAFDAAGWTAGAEHPLVDTNEGINVGPKDDRGRAIAA